MPAGSGRYPSGQRGQTVNLLAYAFGGSNPPLPTIHMSGNSSAVERQPSKLGVAGSNPVSRSRPLSRSATAQPGRSRALGVWGPSRGPHVSRFAHVAQLAEHALGKGEVSGSIPDMGSITRVSIATVDGGM